MRGFQLQSKLTKYFLLFSTFCALILLPSCKNNSSASTTDRVTNEKNVTSKHTKVNQQVSIEQVADLVENEKYQLIDLRTPKEVEKGGTIELSKIMNFRSSDFEQQVDLMDKHGKYILYCKSGGRSAKALKMFNEKGFQNVKEMNAGYDGWSAKFK